MTNRLEKQQITLRLTVLGIQLLDAVAAGSGLGRAAILETVIRKMAEDVEDRIPSVYELLHRQNDFHVLTIGKGRA